MKGMKPRVFAFVQLVLWTSAALSSMSKADTLTHTAGDGEAPADAGLGYQFATATDQRIDNMIRTSSCKSASVTRQGKQVSEDLDQGFLKGIIRSFARTMCRPDAIFDPNDTKTVIGQLQGMKSAEASKKDALSYIDKKQPNVFSGIVSFSPHRENIVKTYSLLLALGQQESNGNTEEGMDQSKSSKKKSDDAATEAGAFQTSQDSLGKGLETPQSRLLAQYSQNWSSMKNDPKAVEKLCMKELYAQSAKKKSSSTKAEDVAAIFAKVIERMTGKGINDSIVNSTEFQSLMKGCPAFAAEYSGILARTNAPHNGPLARSEIRSTPECNLLLSNIGKYLDTAGCSSLDDALSKKNVISLSDPNASFKLGN